MDDRLDVGPVDAHAEGIRRADDRQGTVRESLLDARAPGVVHPGVIGLGRPARRAERLGGAFRALPGRRVHERPSRAHELGQNPALLDLAGDPAHVEPQVGAVETGDEDRGLGEREQRDDVVANLGCGGRRESEDRRPSGSSVGAPAGRGGLSEHAVVGPEVVAPLGDAMRLVDGEAGDRRLGEEASKRCGREALRRHVEKSQPARAHGALGVRRSDGEASEWSAAAAIPLRESSST